MLTMIIVDDEKVIRETIFNLIDWQALNVEVIGLCKNGIEAYNMILDDSPDIVMTDIKMPGLSGLELIARIAQTDFSIEFILLSGYGEFEYAKEAMKHGVKHYLLKPCNESQIIEVIRQVSTDCMKKKAYAHMEEDHQNMMFNFRKSIIRNILTEGLSDNNDLASLVKHYSRYFDFTQTSYDLYYFHFLENNYVDTFIQSLYDFNAQYFPSIPIHFIYVKNTLILFFQSYTLNTTDFDTFLEQLAQSIVERELSIRHLNFHSLTELFEQILQQIRRYDAIYLYNGNHPVLIKNSELSSIQLDTVDAIYELFQTIDDLDLIKSMITNQLLKLPTEHLLSKSPMLATELLMLVQNCDTLEQLRQVIDEKSDLFTLEAPSSDKGYSDYIERIMTIVTENISNPNLSLKWIVENQLYMNVDYVSKQFVRQTNQKFSQYLTHVRICKAKELLLLRGTDKMYTIAEEVGCGNNPHYFSQIFKKITGLTPTEYVKKMT